MGQAVHRRAGRAARDRAGGGRLEGVTFFRSRPLSSSVGWWGSALVILLFIAGQAGIGMNSVYRIRGLRVTPYTLAFTLLPVAATAWVVVLWSRSTTSRLGRVLRLLATVLLVGLSVMVATMTFFVVFVRP